MRKGRVAESDTSCNEQVLARSFGLGHAIPTAQRSERAPRQADLPRGIATLRIGESLFGHTGNLGRLVAEERLSITKSTDYKQHIDVQRIK